MLWQSILVMTKPILLVVLLLTPSFAMGQTFTIHTSSVAPGGTITFTVANGSGHPLDWVGLYPVDQSDLRGSYLRWQFLNGTLSPPPTGIRNATLQFVVPTTPGAYVIRWFGSGGYTPVAASATITVVDTPPPGNDDQRWFRFCLDDGVTCYEGMLQRVPGGIE